MSLDFSLGMHCEVGGSNLLSYSSLHIGLYKTVKRKCNAVFFTKHKNIEANTNICNAF